MLRGDCFTPAGFAMTGFRDHPQHPNMGEEEEMTQGQEDPGLVFSKH
jgi:hypothetical protein